jgi:hypothetical protein
MKLIGALGEAILLAWPGAMRCPICFWCGVAGYFFSDMLHKLQ